MNTPSPSREYQPQSSSALDQINKHSREVQLERRENTKVSVEFSLQLFHQEEEEEEKRSKCFFFSTSRRISVANEKSRSETISIVALSDW